MSPTDLVQIQLDAYNNKDIESWLATYLDDAIQITTDGLLIAQGKV